MSSKFGLAGDDDFRIKVCADGSAFYDGRAVGRVRMVDAGLQTGQWLWSSYWSGSDAGRTDSLEASLAAFKAVASPDKLALVPPDPPGRQRGAPK